MNKVIDRERNLLNILIKEYIKRAKPISSDYLKEKYNLSVCSATIRNDMHRLSEMGYLAKDYASAGRIPTEKAYRFFAEQVLDHLESEKKSCKFLQEIDYYQDELEYISFLTKKLASYSCSFALVYCDNHFYKEGWQEIIRHPEFAEIETLKSFLKKIEKIEQNIDILTEDCFQINVYIGKESNIDLKDFSLIMGKTVFPQKQEVILALIGPKRMNYNKNIELINSIIKTLEQEK